MDSNYLTLFIFDGECSLLEGRKERNLFTRKEVKDKGDGEEVGAKERRNATSRSRRNCLKILKKL